MNVDVFASLADYALENEQEELLSTPLAGLLDLIDLGDAARRAIKAELALNQAADLGDITQDQNTRLRVLGQLTARDAEAAAAKITDWITAKLNEAEAAKLALVKKPNRSVVEKRPVAAEPPDNLDALVAWAKRRRVAHLLHVDARDLIVNKSHDMLLYGYGAVTVANVIVDEDYAGQPLSTRRSTLLGMRDEAIRALSDASLAFEEASQADDARLKGYDAAARTLESGRQMRFARSLLALRSELQAGVCPALPTTLPPALSLLINPPRVEATVSLEDLRYGAHRSVATISINLLSLSAEKLAVQQSTPAPLAVIVFIDAVLAALLDLTHPLHGAFTLMIEKPAWVHALDALELATEAQPEEEKPKSVLSWRVSFSNHGVRFVACVHKPLKRGGFSTGTEIDIDRIKRVPDLMLLPADAALMRAVRERTQTFSTTLERDYPLLELLIGHPRVYAVNDENVDEREPLKIVRAQLGLSLTTAHDGSTKIVASIADKAVELSALQTSTSYRYNEANRTVELIMLTTEQMRLLSTISLHDVVFPVEAQAALLDRVARISHIAPVTLPEAMRGEEIEATTAPTLRLTPQAQALDMELIVRPLGAGVALRPGSGSVEVSGLRDGRRVNTHRDLGGERKAAIALIETLGLDLDLETPRSSIIGDGEVLAFLERLRDRSDVRVEWTRDPMTLSKPIGASSLKVTVRASADWFGLEGMIDMEGESVQLALVLDALRRGERYVKIGAQKWMALEQSLRDRLAFLAEATHETKEGLEVDNYAAESIRALLDAGAQGEIDKEFTIKIDRIRSADLTPQDLPTAFEGELRPYQIEGFQWLCRLEAWGVGGVLADDMGLGKTIQALAMLVRRAPAGPALVVAPTSLVFNWQREAAKFAPSLRVRLYRDEGVPKDLGPGDVLVASYGLITRDTNAFDDAKLATLVIDEAQAIKNADTQRAKALRSIKAEWTIALTGTPLENHLADLWSLFRVVTPGFLGSWDRFRDRFATPIERHGSTEKRRVLSRLVRPFLLRRTKSKVLDDLPAKTDIDVNVELSEGEKALYEQARLAAVARIKKADGDARFVALAALTTLRRLVCHPRLYDDQSTLSSSKLETFLRMLDELRENHHRALVFSQFTTHLALVREALEARGISYQYLDGQTPERERSKRVDAFQRGEGLVFLVSLKAGGTGLNLTAADYVFHLDPWWNPAVEEQASSRAHRMGQTRPVTVYRLIARGTVEEKIVALHRDKRELAEALIGESDTAGKVMSANEIVSLLQER